MKKCLDFLIKIEYQSVTGSCIIPEERMNSRKFLLFLVGLLIAIMLSIGFSQITKQSNHRDPGPLSTVTAKRL